MINICFISYFCTKFYLKNSLKQRGDPRLCRGGRSHLIRSDQLLSLAKSAEKVWGGPLHRLFANDVSGGCKSEANHPRGRGLGPRSVSGVEGAAAPGSGGEGAAAPGSGVAGAAAPEIQRRSIITL